jgi:ABC-type branched-subunit amino acid transport system substrate-binding protein
VRKSVHLALLLTMALLLTTACGARLSDEQLRAATAAGNANTGTLGAGAAGGTDGGAATGSDAAPGTDTGSAGSGATGGTDGGAATASDAGAAGGASTGASAGGGAAGGGATQAAGGPCRSSGGATDKGVSATEIRIGNVSTISGPVTGLGQTAQNGVKAYVAYINSKGGVCGRALKLVTADDRLDTGANRSETQRLMNDVFGFVGNFSVVDDGGAAVLDGTNVPDVGLSISEQRKALPTNFSPNPLQPGAKSNGTVKMMQFFKSNYGVTKAGIIYPAQATAKASALNYETDMKAAGINVVAKAEVAITQTDYNGVATQMKNAGAELVITTLEQTGMARLAQAFKQQGYQPKVPYYGAQAYGKKFLAQAGDAANGTLIGAAYDIPEDAGINPIMGTMAQWYNRVNPGADLDFFAIESWAATDMFVKALTAAGGAPTRDAVVKTLKGYTDFTADGVLANGTNPAGKTPSSCFIVLGVEGGKWKRIAPAKGFQC